MNNYDYIKDIDIAKDLLNMNETEIASFIGIPRSTLNKWRKGDCQISRTYLEKVYSSIFRKCPYINRTKEQMYCDMNNKNALYLFHGAKKDIEGELSLSHSSSKNDFGKGIYLGDSLFQSASFVANYPESSVYICKLENLNKCKVVQYDVDTEWMLTIAYYRGKLSRYENSKYLKDILLKMNHADIVIAPIADNRMFCILDEFIEGEITDIQCRHALSATDLGKQYVLVSEKSMKQLSIVHHCYLCREEKESFLLEKEKSGEIGSQKVKLAKREYAGKGKYIEELLQ